MKNTLGLRIKQLRTDAGITQTEFGKLFSLAKSTVSQYESSSSRPDDELKIKIAQHFNVSLDWLLGLSDKKEQFEPGPYNDFLLKCVKEGIFKEGEQPDEDLIDELIEIMKVTAKQHRKRRA